MSQVDMAADDSEAASAPLRDRTALIVGASGAFASSLVAHLETAGFEVIAIDPDMSWFFDVNDDGLRGPVSPDRAAAARIIETVEPGLSWAEIIVCQATTDTFRAGSALRGNDWRMLFLTCNAFPELAMRRLQRVATGAAPRQIVTICHVGANADPSGCHRSTLRAIFDRQTAETVMAGCRDSPRRGTVLLDDEHADQAPEALRMLTTPSVSSSPMRVPTGRADALSSFFSS